ncbi:amidohydrolase [Psychrobacillus sp. NEAU-3TGS]|nr:amidohydrolase [Psychrobacillus sp. NEAU-3TGS]
MMKLSETVASIEQYVIDIRRDLHRHPEIGLQEVRTMNVVTEELSNMGIPYEIVPDGGIIGFIHGAQPGRTLILRADLDALPMKESLFNLKQKKAITSTIPNAAHTCGHDAHTAMLLGAAKILSSKREQIAGAIILAFEQGEEMGGGIKNLLNRLHQIGADGIWGIHLKSDLQAGKISVDAGPRMAAASGFRVVLKGKAGHGSRPDLAVSPVDCFVDFYQALRNMRHSRLSPFETITYSLGIVQAGSALNIIPDTLEFAGSFRYLNTEQGEQAIDVFKDLLTHVSDMHSCTFEYKMEPVVSDLVVMNEATCAGIATAAIEQTLGKEALATIPAWMASESFSFYLKYFPGVFAFLGVQNEEQGMGAEHHNEHFDIDESALTVGVTSTVQYALDFLDYKGTITYTVAEKDVHELLAQFGF